MRADWVGALLLGSLLSTACTPKKAQESVEGGGAADAAIDEAKACAKIEALGGAMSPRERDLCLGQYGSLGPNVRACFDPCIMQAADKGDYEVCKDDCTSQAGLARTICQRAFNVFDEKPRIEECVVRFTKVESTDKPKARCVAKCMGAAREPTVTLDTCSTQCGAPTLGHL